MAQKLSQLPQALLSTSSFVIMDEAQGKYILALIDGNDNSTGQDIAVFFSTQDKAVAYRDKYPSLARLNVYEATVKEMAEIFNGRVEYYIVDNPAFA